MLALLVTSVRPLRSQARVAPGAVLLQVRPHPGDTIRVRLDQSVEISGVAMTGGATRGATESGTLVLLALLAVESSDLNGSTIVSHTDSVRVNAEPNSASAAVLAWAAASAGRAVRFRIAPNGSAAVPSARGGTMPTGPLATQMPATLPPGPIAPGATWNSTLRVPLAGSLEPGATATLVAAFVFDSLSRSGELAFLSLHGRVMKGPDDAAGERTGSIVETSGTVVGTVTLDRRRGWITDARTTFTLQSLVTPADRSRPPAKVRMTISQWLRAM